MDGRTAGHLGVESVGPAVPPVEGSDRGVHFSGESLGGALGGVVEVVTVGGSEDEDVHVCGGAAGDPVIASSP